MITQLLLGLAFWGWLVIGMTLGGSAVWIGLWTYLNRPHVGQRP